MGTAQPSRPGPPTQANSPGVERASRPLTRDDQSACCRESHRQAIVSVQSAAAQPIEWIESGQKCRAQARRKTSGGSTAKPSRSASAGWGSLARTIVIGPWPAQSQAINRCGCSLPALATGRTAPLDLLRPLRYAGRTHSTAGCCTSRKRSVSFSTDREEFGVKCPLSSPTQSRFRRSLPWPWHQNHVCSS